MLLLPTFNARLNPCPVGPEAFTPQDQGRFCGQCQRVVLDFSQSADPVADLAAARAAAPDGRVCGSFRASQVAAPPLSRRLKWFVLALVLIVGQGLTAREGLAQVRQATVVPTPEPTRIALLKPTPMHGLEDLKNLEPEMPQPTPAVYSGSVEQMPYLHNRGGTKAIVDRIHAQLRWPKQEDGRILQVEGRMYASFTVEADGQISNVKTVKSLHPILDEAALEAIRGLTDIVPGRQGNRPVPMSLTVPITFRLK
ncbi:hypothetical protein GCM10023185_03510 [Hymenobacter saemangeumensis]|uniref:TonB C-terminal domain-containing protein n=1 Tax=Hymenobacter saemangeumensis TaxID=1084522 RepID=A0ABP8HZ27_9BACT